MTLFPAISLLMKYDNMKTLLHEWRDKGYKSDENPTHSRLKKQMTFIAFGYETEIRDIVSFCYNKSITHWSLTKTEWEDCNTFDVAMTGARMCEQSNKS